MVAAANPFEQSVIQQISLNKARSPTERFLALCELLDAARAMAPMDSQARERRLRAARLREQDREQWRAQCGRFFAAERSKTVGGSRGSTDE